MNMNQNIMNPLGKRLVKLVLIIVVTGVVGFIGWWFIVRSTFHQLTTYGNDNQNISVAERLVIDNAATASWKEYMSIDERNYEKYSVRYPSDWSASPVERNQGDRTFVSAVSLSPKNGIINGEGEQPDEGMLIELGPTILPSDISNQRIITINDAQTIEGTVEGTPNTKFYRIESKSGHVYEASWPLIYDRPLYRQILSTLIISIK